MPIWAGFMKRTFADEHWSSLQKDTFAISEASRNQLMCEDFRENKPFEFKPFKALKEKKLFKNLFRRRRK
jgi:hypothetical protein